MKIMYYKRNIGNLDRMKNYIVKYWLLDCTNCSYYSKVFSCTPDTTIEMTPQFFWVVKTNLTFLV